MHRSVSQPLSRRDFIARAGALAGLGALSLPSAADARAASVPGTPAPFRVRRATATFEREPLVRPSGFKGGYMTEFWQSAALLESESGVAKVGLGTQNVLWCDPTVLEHFSESGGNSLQFAVTDRALQMIEGNSFGTPIDMLEGIFDELYAYAQKITGLPALHPAFVTNALIPVDNAAWLLHAAENGFTTFDQMIPARYRPGLSHRHRQVASLPSVTFALPVEEVKKTAEEGYFIIKMKLGHPGTQEEMIQRDMTRLTEVVRAIDHLRTPHTSDGRLRYDFDPNSRYESKDTLLRLLDHSRKLGILDRIVVVEEPFGAENETPVGDLPVLIAADESATTLAEASRRFDLGYRGMALKGIAKTLSRTLQIAQLSHERGVHCMAADLTVNPILVDWNKNVAARLAPFPGMTVGMMETNGHQQYRNWKQMESYHPCANSSWRRVSRGVFELGEDFYARSGCIFEKSPHFEGLVRPDV
ncbi:MAG: twin-arginine translocation signal domain-containing protein [Gemmatimonadetes bacterium]|nr:twin-arginine translocation signal domain-containing protein [Gemmatimonadota bacterium]